ncbi:MAG: FRG domain-containing protein [Nitrospirota bacterium]|nr:FRG domain-containing protein [Nitrospirota bacterium]MDP2382377.1 FRG domain-containing protein [Nitrospirota bacterium]MDP3599351.1 FRG domain-containing protein [Nitrospirota bacterium]
MAEQNIISDLASLEKAILLMESKFSSTPDFWWRGHSLLEWDLVPSVYRLGRDVDEHNYAWTFLQYAPSRYERCPAEKNWAAWLFLMQHYGVPTRLLDWTKSALIGLYFAVADPQHDEKPGALWGLQPSLLNKFQASIDGLIPVDDDRVRRLAEDAFAHMMPKKSQQIIAVPTQQRDVRHLVQESMFTLHGSSQPLNKFEISKEYLVYWEIPSSSKSRLRYTLDRMGMNGANLFPDLENLARHVGSLEFRKPDV